MYRHEYTKTRQPTPEEWARIEQIANWVIENTPETVKLPGPLAVSEPLRGTLHTLYEFKDRFSDELLDDEIDLEHEPSNVVQEFYGSKAIRLNSAYDGGSWFTLTSMTEEQDREFGLDGYCDTKRRPYDLLVCAILALVEHWIPGLLLLKSEGNATDWQPAIDFAKGYDPAVEVPRAVRFGTHANTRTVIDRPAYMDFRA